MPDLANPLDDRFGAGAKSEADANPTRRTFLMCSAGALAAGYGGLLGYPVYRYLASPVEKAAYRRPREFTWWSGVVLLLLTMLFGFSGYLLPMDELAYFATKVGIS
jgi:hypothetical protein